MPTSRMTLFRGQFVNAIKIMRGKHSLSKTELSGDDEASLRELFDSIDIDKSGTLEMDEYFVWSLDVASRQGCGLELVFKKYDVHGDGMLDVNEFALAVEDLGFSATFAQCDTVLRSTVCCRLFAADCSLQTVHL